MVTAEATLTKWGNGRGMLLPKAICDKMGIDVGDVLTLAFDESSRAIRVEPKESYTLQSLMRGYSGPKPGEIDAPVSPVGGELW